MRKPLALLAPLAAVCAIFALALYAVTPALTSDHQDSPFTVSRPGADITDMYVFPAKNPKNVVFAMNVHPLIPKGLASSVAFDPGVMYQIKIDMAGDYREHVALEFKATGTGPQQSIAFYGPVRVTPSLRSRFPDSPTGSTTLGKTTHLPGGMTFYAGARRDPFFFDLAQFFAIVPDRNFKNHPNVPAATASCFRKPGSNFLASFNVLSLVVEMPRTALTTMKNRGRINVWATTSVAAVPGGAYVQAERWGRPAVKEALESFAQHDESNRVEPYADPILEGAIYKTVTTAKSAGGAGRSPAIANALVKVLVPDEMQVDLKAYGPATYLAVETNGKSGLPTGIVRIVPDAALKGLKASLKNGTRLFGGRDTESPVIDLSLGSVYGSLIPKLGLAHDDDAETPCLTSDFTQPAEPQKDGFPYLNPPV